MKIEKIKPIPKYIISKIQKLDREKNSIRNGYTRYYAYLTTNDKELVKVTVAVRHKYSKWYCKQVAVHGVHSKDCFCKDLAFSIYGGWCTGWYSEGLTGYRKWYESAEWEEADDKYCDPFAPVVNKEYIAKFPEYKYSAYDLYNGVDILQYLRLYEKYPQTEYILKLGISTQFVNSKQILKLVEKDKQFRKWLSAKCTELKYTDYYVSTVIQAYKKNKSLREMQRYERVKKDLCKEKRFEPIRKMLNGEYEKYSNYIEKQQISNGLYLDYLTACNFLELDMSEEKNRFPHNFKQWHDIRIDEYHTAKAIKDEEERKDLYLKFADISKKYLPLEYDKKDKFAVIIAKSPAELMREGDKLNHCVGRMNYDQKFIREETLIFFIRNRDNIDEPFVTAEFSIDKKKILQCYAANNTTPDNKVTEYINRIWLPYAKRTLKRISA